MPNPARRPPAPPPLAHGSPRPVAPHVQAAMASVQAKMAVSPAARDPRPAIPSAARQPAPHVLAATAAPRPAARPVAAQAKPARFERLARSPASDLPRRGAAGTIQRSCLWSWCCSSPKSSGYVKPEEDTSQVEIEAPRPKTVTVSERQFTENLPFGTPIFPGGFTSCVMVAFRLKDDFAVWHAKSASGSNITGPSGGVLAIDMVLDDDYGGGYKLGKSDYDAIASALEDRYGKTPKIHGYSGTPLFTVTESGISFFKATVTSY